MIAQMSRVLKSSLSFDDCRTVLGQTLVALEVRRDRNHRRLVLEAGQRVGQLLAEVPVVLGARVDNRL